MAGDISTAEITCAQCGIRFTVARKRNWHNRKFCTDECARQAKQAYRPAYLREWAKRRIPCPHKGVKTCRVCGLEKPVTQFHRSTNYADGRQTRCAACSAEYGKRLSLTPEQLARRRENKRNWKQENKDRVREYTAKSREKNTERHKLWRYANPDKWAAVVRARDGRKRGGMGHITGRKMREWTAAQKKVCHWCGVNCADAFQVDHIIPLKRGGPHEASNLCIACPTCNQRKSAKDPIDFAREIGKLL